MYMYLFYSLNSCVTVTGHYVLLNSSNAMDILKSYPHISLAYVDILNKGHLYKDSPSSLKDSYDFITMKCV